MSLSNPSISSEQSEQQPAAPTAWRLVDLREFADARGKLSVVEGGKDIPFQIQRAFYLHEVPHDAHRAGHALKTCHEFLIAVSGSFRIRVTDGMTEEIIVLDRPNFGFYLPPMLWCVLDQFSSEAVCLVLASTDYDGCEQIQNWDEYKAALLDMR